MALIFFSIVVRGTYLLGKSQMSSQSELIKNLNKQEVKNYLQIAQEAVKASYDKTKEENTIINNSVFNLLTIVFASINFPLTKR